MYIWIQVSPRLDTRRWDYLNVVRNSFLKAFSSINDMVPYDKVLREFNKRVPTAKKLITRPIMTVTSPNSPHIALTYTKLRSDHFFDHNYPPSWS